MHGFEFILLLLAAVILSNLINHFIPWISVPLVQIVLGILIEYLPFSMSFELEPELFFLLFLAPLVFNSTMMLDKKTMRDMRNPILMSAIGLVFVTVFAVGYATHLLIPAIPIMAAFAMAAALGPTDVVAVEAAAKRVVLPHKIMGILEGESIINDATGIVCFMFVVIAAETGSVDLASGLRFFLFLSLGGLLVGGVLTVLKFVLIRWFRSLHIETISLNISFGLMTPFIIYMVSESIGVSGILAVFSSGMIHSMYKDNLNPEVFNLHKAQQDVWNMFTYILDGLVFVILGTQLPHILRSYFSNTPDVNVFQLIISIIVVFLLLMIVRFLWWLLTVRRKVYDDPATPLGKVKSGMIFSLAGARGEIPLAIILSIPLLLDNGQPFPERDLIILMVGGVITISLLVTNFVLPLLVAATQEAIPSETEETARIEILRTVVDRLMEASNPENFPATEIVTRYYYSRIDQHKAEARKLQKNRKKKHVQRDILFWEKDVILRMTEDGSITKTAAGQYLSVIDREVAENKNETNPIKLMGWTLQQLIQILVWRRRRLNSKHIMDQKPYKRNAPDGEEDQLIKTVRSIAANGFHIERILIQRKLEEGRISWESAKQMQANITMLEAHLLMK